MIKINKIFFYFKESKRLKVGIILLFLYCLNLVPVFNSFINTFEYYLINFRHAIVNQKHVSDKIVIIDIDASSINKLNIWPFPRHYWARIIENINKNGAKVIGIDVLFDNESANKTQDQIFSESLKNVDNTVLAARKYIDKRNNYMIETWSKPISLFSQFSTFGFINFPYDKDGVVRKSFQELSSKSKHSVESFDFLTASKFLNVELAVLKQNFKKNFFNHTNTNQNTFHINYSLSSQFNRIPFYLMYENRIPEPNFLKDKIVLIGATDPVLNDIIFSPLGMMPGVDIHAHNILTLLENKPIYDFSKRLTNLIIYILLGLISFTVFKYNVKKSSLIIAGILTGYSLLPITAFILFDYLIIWAAFIFLGILCMLISNLIKLLYEENEKKYIRSLFSQYVSPAVVNELIKFPEALNLGGQKKRSYYIFL